MNGEDLESVIRRHVLLGKRSPKGFEVVKCAKCLDHKVRGGFKFDAGTVVYSCFNCSTKAFYEPSSVKATKTFKEVLIAFGVPEDEIDAATALNFFKPKDPQAAPSQKPEKKSLGFPTKEVPLPSNTVKITTDDSPWCEVAREYLKGRSLDPAEYPYFVSDNTSYVGRLIIPYYFRDKLIYWQGRALDESIEPRYKNPSVEKENIFFNMDEVYRYTDEPLFVHEGSTDALSVGKHGVALTGAEIGDFRWTELNRVAQRRKVIFVIDKNLPGYKLGMKVLKEGHLNMFVVCFPQNIDDANDAVKKLGRLWTINYVLQNAVREFQGQALLELNCKRK